MSKKQLKKAERIKKARSFLISVDCYKIAKEIFLFSQIQDIERNLLYHNIEDLEAELNIQKKNIELNRIIACEQAKNQRYQIKFNFFCMICHRSLFLEPIKPL